jgi:polyhydroxyalkanoate synthesis regulator phasin
MRKSLVPIALTALLAGGAGAMAFAPSFAGAQDSGSTTTTEETADRPHPLEDAIQALVADGTITQDQADKVIAAVKAARPDHGPGPRHHVAKVELQAAADYLGVSIEDVRTALQDGKTLATLAGEQGKDVDGLIAALVDATSARIDKAVADGKLTQEQADEAKANLQDHVTHFVNEGGPRPGPGGPRGPRGPRPGAPTASDAS